jgi:hypothetical protein
MNVTQQKNGDLENGDLPDMRDALNEAVSDAVGHWNSATRAITTSATQGACFVISLGKLLALLTARGFERAEEWIQLDDPTTETAIRRRLAQEPALAIVEKPDHGFHLLAPHASSHAKSDTARCS